MSLISIDTAARLSGIPASTWRRWISEDRITAVRQGHRSLLQVRDVMQLAAWREARGACIVRDE